MSIKTIGRIARKMARESSKIRAKNVGVPAWVIWQTRKNPQDLTALLEQPEQSNTNTADSDPSSQL